jgi:hypothetical protein
VTVKLTCIMPLQTLAINNLRSHPSRNHLDTWIARSSADRSAFLPDAGDESFKCYWGFLPSELQRHIALARSLLGHLSIVLDIKRVAHLEQSHACLRISFLVSCIASGMTDWTYRCRTGRSCRRCAWPGTQRLHGLVWPEQWLPSIRMPTRGTEHLRFPSRPSSRISTIEPWQSCRP